MFFFNRNTPQKEHHFGLFLKEERGTAFLFEIDHDRIQIVGHESIVYSNGWENIMQDVDDAFSKLEAQSKLHPKKVIFFLYSYFIDQEKIEIKEPYKTIIKNISKHMDLAPLGYIECCEAVASYIERRDQSPLNVILVELDKKNIDICIYKGSRRVVTKCISRTDSMVQDLSSVFSTIKNNVLLPSRMVLYDSSDLDGDSAAILSHKWDKDTFVQHPRVEVIKEQDLYQELAWIFVFQLYGDKQATTTIVTPALTTAESIAATPLPSEQPNIQLSSKTSPAALYQQPNDSLGFTIQEEGEEPLVATATDSPIRKPIPSGFKPALPPMRFHMPSFKGAVKFSGAKLACIIGVILIAIGLFLIEYKFHKATITILLPSKEISKDITISDVSIETATASASVTGNTVATGKRDIGEKARGEVTIHNFDDKIRVIDKGTQLEVDGKVFTLDNEVTVASASEVLSDSGPVKQTGKSKVNATASVIGPDSNLEKNKRLKVGDLSTSLYFGVNESAFSGGTKKTVRTVAKRDLDDLQKSLLDKGRKEAIEGTKKNLSGTDKILDELTEVESDDVSPSKEVGEESDQLSMTVKVLATYYTFDDEEMKNKLLTMLGSDVPSGFELDKSKIVYTINKVDKDKDSSVISLELDVKANTTKTIEPSEIAQKVKGKQEKELKAILKDDAQISGYVLDVSSPLPILKDWVPFFQQNIDVRLSSL